MENNNTERVSFNLDKDIVEKIKTFADKDGYVNDCITRSFVPESMKVLEILGDHLVTMGNIENYRELSENEREFYNVCDFCYELLKRTELAFSYKIKKPDEMCEVWEEPGEIIPRYALSNNLLADEVIEKIR